MLQLGIDGEDVSEPESSKKDEIKHYSEENILKNDATGLLSLGLEPGDSPGLNQDEKEKHAQQSSIPEEPQIRTIPSTSVTAGLLDLESI